MAYQKRQTLGKKIPLPRKGTKYVARPLSFKTDSVPVVIAVRDMLRLSRTTSEVKKMLNQKLLKINNKIASDRRESIKLFSLFHADKTYILTLSETGKFIFEMADNANQRLCKVVGKSVVKGAKTQLNLHDGSNILTEEKININDSVYLDFEGKIKKYIPLETGKEAIIISGKHIGSKGKIESVEQNRVSIKFANKEGSALIDSSRVVVQ